MDIHSPAYQKTFIRYLRRGTAIELTLKAQIHPTTHYIWRTRADEKARSSHAANNGKIFAWDDPPPTGHPGDEFGCRCWAEPYYGAIDTELPDDPPIEPVYPELFLIPLLRVGAGALKLAISLVRRKPKTIDKPENLTEHGITRFIERQISKQEVTLAIKSAKETGNVITKTGKYGTPQIHYEGTNGITVIVETTGRNAGKIITYWRH